MKKMNKMFNGNWKKGLSIVTASTLVCGSLGISVYAQEETVPALAGGAFIQAAERSILQAPKNVELSGQDKEQLSKEETVYVIADADGTPQKLIVSDWLKNAAGMSAVTDATELTDINNMKGNENFQKKDGNLGIWDAEGNDIYYQGSIQKALPVDMRITYKLNGKQVSPEELAGQSGKVTIRFDYDNKQKEKVQVGEKEEELYVPFVILTGVVLDNDHFHNIQVSNGKVLNDGERTMVMGYAMPGLKENLDTGSEEFNIDDLNISDYVELTADVEDFELATTLTVATNEIFGDMDVNMQDKMDGLSADMDDLQDAMKKLMDGTSELYDGTGELYDGAEDLDEGVQKLDDGAKKLKDGTGTLKSGAGDLVNGVNSLVSGLEELTKNNNALVSASKGLFQKDLAKANATFANANVSIGGQTVPLSQVLAMLGIENGVLTEKNYGKFSAMLQPLMKQMQQGQTTMAIALEEEQEETEEQIPKEEKELSLETENRDSKPETEEAENIKEDNIEDETLAEDIQETEEKPESLDEENEEQEEVTKEAEQMEQMEQAEIQANVQERENLLVQAGPTQADIMQALAPLLQNPAVVELITSLETHYQLYQGILQYTEGVGKAYKGSKDLLDGAKKLKDGASELQSGAGELKDGTSELKDGTLKLLDGVLALQDGSLELKDGTEEFNEDGIQKLVDMLDGDLQDLNNRFEATKEAARAYKSFAGISDEMQGKVKFIYKTAAIEK